jgi:hypothetical protein
MTDSDNNHTKERGLTFDYRFAKSDYELQNEARDYSSASSKAKCFARAEDPHQTSKRG